MQYLDIDRFEAVDPASFQDQKPFPWLNPKDLVPRAAWDELERNLPPLELFEKRYGEARQGGQAPHDRYSLEYHGQPEVPQAWHDFIGELCGARYRNVVQRLLGARRVEFRFHWHYALPGSSVSPHVDASREYGSHIFYFNEPGWDPAWGGQTLILDDGGRFQQREGPAFEDFDTVVTASSDPGSSVFFSGRKSGWHGVKPIACPEGHMRRVFIVVINPNSLFWRVRDRLIGKDIQRY